MADCGVADCGLADSRDPSDSDLWQQETVVLLSPEWPMGGAVPHLAREVAVAD